VASKEKPYRIYKAGRVRGPIKPLPPPERGPVPIEGANGSQPPPTLPPVEAPHPERAPRPHRPRPRRRWLRWVLVGFLVLALLTVAWGAAGYFSLRSGVAQANERLPEGTRKALTPQPGSILSSPTTTLLLGADHGPGRADAGRSDAIVLVRTDPDNHRVSLLSIPRDLRVEIPGYGPNKINAAYAFGGPQLAIETVEQVTGVKVNHVALVDFSTFGELIDALGGVTVDVPKRIVSTRFDCPYATQARCERWQGWQFKPGEQTMDGQRALIYSRIRENTLDPSENDLTRGGRQQQVVQAISDELVSFTGFLRMPFIGDDAMKPLATDLSTSQVLELGWVKFRSSGTLRCRLGGDGGVVDGVAYILGTEQNVAVVSMFTGDAAPQPPPRCAGAFAPGCDV
jgi:LCP family protein required for cell wall assembly